MNRRTVSVGPARRVVVVGAGERLPEPFPEGYMRGADINRRRADQRAKELAAQEAKALAAATTTGGSK